MEAIKIDIKKWVYLSNDLNIPEKDLRYMMPLRWKFHIWAAGGTAEWEFEEWREYLLGWKKGGMEFFISYMLRYPIVTDKDALIRGYKCLQSYNATTLGGFIRFYRQCLKEYESALGHLNRKRNL